MSAVRSAVIVTSGSSAFEQAAPVRWLTARNEAVVPRCCLLGEAIDGLPRQAHATNDDPPLRQAGGATIRCLTNHADGDDAMADAKNLDESLNRLRSEIEALGSQDEEARQRLGRLLRDIETTLENPKRRDAGETLGEQLRASILNFEASHPRLATLMNDVMEKLGAMGI